MPRYARPPITEAVIEFQFSRHFPVEVPKKAADRLAARYFFAEEDNLKNFHLDLERASVHVEQQLSGRKLSSLDRTEVVIFRGSAFVCSQLAPYSSWDGFRARAVDAWNTWRKVAGSTELSRVGLRYINRIDVPGNRENLLRIEDLLRVYPAEPALELPPINTYTMQILRPLGADNCHLMINSGTTPSPLLNHLSFLLDIDVSKDAGIPRKDEEIWELIDRMRAHKNRIFEACITDNARKLFGP